MPVFVNIIAKQRLIQIAFETLADVMLVAEECHPLLPRIIFWSPKNAAVTHGPSWFFHLTRQAQEKIMFPIQAILDCGDRPDLVQQSLSLGIKKVCFQGEHTVFKKLQQIAAFYQADLYDRPAQEILNISCLNNTDKNIKEYLNSMGA